MSKKKTTVIVNMGGQQQSPPPPPPPQGQRPQFPPLDLTGVNTAKSRLDVFQLQSSQMEKSVKAMLETLKTISSFYNQFTQMILDPWLSFAPPKVTSADDRLKANGLEFDAFVDKINISLGPRFFNALKTHDAQLKELCALEKRRMSAQKEHEKKEIACKAEVGAPHPNQAKISIAADELYTARNELDQLNLKFVNDVYQFELGRQKQLTEAFSGLYGMICQLINFGAKLTPIDFPTDHKDYFMKPDAPYIPVYHSSSSISIGEQPSQDLPSEPVKIDQPSSAYQVPPPSGASPYQEPPPLGAGPYQAPPPSTPPQYQVPPPSGDTPYQNNTTTASPL